MSYRDVKPLAGLAKKERDAFDAVVLETLRRLGREVPVSELCSEVPHKAFMVGVRSAGSATKASRRNRSKRVAASCRRLERAGKMISRTVARDRASKRTIRLYRDADVTVRDALPDEVQSA